MQKNKVYSFIGLARKAGAIASGEWLAEQAVRSRKAYLVLIAGDASENTKKKIGTAIYGRNVPLVEFGSKEKLGYMLGKDAISVLAVTDKGFAGRIKELVEQEHNIDNIAHGGGFFEQTENS